MAEYEWIADDIFVIRNFLSNQECDELVVRAAKIGFADAPIDLGFGRQAVVKDVRNNTRVMVDDDALAMDFWLKARAYVPDEINGAKAVGFNERFRFYRYEPGQRFNWHVDGAFVRGWNSEVSQMSFIVYLNDAFQGGATRFQDVAIAAEKGKALCFRHSLLHEGAIVTHGVKCVVRSDVMYG